MKTSIAFDIEVVSENALLLSWQQTISAVQHSDIIALQTQLNAQLTELIIESVASYHCLMIYYDFLKINTDELITKIHDIASTNSPEKDKLSGDIHSATPLTEQPCISIPVYYDTEQEWDLRAVAQQCGISIEEVIKLHSSSVYRSYALGFTPGFCYLASLPKALTLPRKSTPRTKVPKGAVAIAEQQTAVYPNESPGGWHIIGQIPLAMYQTHNGEFTPAITVGKNVQFYAISKAQFLAMKQSEKL